MNLFDFHSDTDLRTLIETVYEIAYREGEDSKFADWTALSNDFPELAIEKIRKEAYTAGAEEMKRRVLGVFPTKDTTPSTNEHEKGYEVGFNSCLSFIKDRVEKIEV